MRARTRRLAVVALVTSLFVAATPAPSGGAGTPTPWAHDFPDVVDSNPFHDEISWMVEQGYIAGYADGTFRPATAMSRQATVQMLWEMSGSPPGPFPDETYSDVGPTHPFITAIEWAAEVDAMQGYPDGTFRSTTPVSRQALASILHDLSGIEREFGHENFSDVTAGHPFADDIWWWAGSNQANGYSDGTFRPEAPVTRQAGAALLSNFYRTMRGYWPFASHHDHACDVPPTEAQEAKADQIIADVEEVVSTTYPNFQAALAAGYRLNAPPAAGEGWHMVNDDYTSDGINIDDASEYEEAVTKPESLVLDAGSLAANPPVAAAMFIREYIGPTPWPPDPVGCLGTWHAHDTLCIGAGILSDSMVVGLATFPTGCPAGSMLRITPEMFHVWRDAYWDGGPFDGIET
jgi:hypothetical protein